MNNENNLRSQFKNELSQLVESHGNDQVEEAIAYGGLLDVLEFSKKEFGVDFCAVDCLEYAFQQI